MSIETTTAYYIDQGQYINNSRYTQRHIPQSNNLNRTPNADIFTLQNPDTKKEKKVLGKFIEEFVPIKQDKKAFFPFQKQVVLPEGTQDFRNVKDGTLLPKNQPVVVGKNAILSLAGIAELDLNSEYIAPFVRDMKNGQSFTVGRNGNLITHDRSRLISGIHAEISKQNDQIVVKDMSMNGTQVSYNKINPNEFVRNIGNNGYSVDNNYLKTSKEVRFYLNKAIESGSYIQSFNEYKRTVCFAHKIAYCGFSGNEHWYKKHGRLLQIEPYNVRTYNGRLRSNYTDKAQEVEQIAKRYADPYRANNPNYTTVKLNGISPSGLPANSESTHLYPTADYLDEYFVQMYRTSKEAINLINNNANKKLIIDKIAEHYQYAVNARPFEQINNSLFMNEVNTLLKKAGMQTIPHGILDHAAQRLQPQTFIKYFEDYYMANRLL